jgi:phage terminase Nu1 subunit (DNA packaging protein)
VDKQYRKLQRRAIAGDHSAYLRLCRLQERSGIMHPWTVFKDSHSHGWSKAEYEKVWIQAPRAQAVKIYEGRWVNPEGASCPCCGKDYYIEEDVDLHQATGFERGCAWDRLADRYVEKAKYIDGFKSLEDFLANLRPDHLILSRQDFTPEEASLVMGELRPNPPPRKKYTQRPPLTCRVCGVRTNQTRKPYCSEHLDEAPYITQLQKLIEEKDSEIDAVRRYGVTAIHSGSETLRDIITQIKEFGPQYIGELAKLIYIDKEITKVYVDHLMDLGHLKWTWPLDCEWSVDAPREKYTISLTGRPVAPQYTRETSAEEIARIYELSPLTIKSWARAGAPHTVTKAGKVFNLEEFDTWYKIHQDETRRKRSTATRSRRETQLSKIDRSGPRNLTRGEVYSALNIADHTLDSWVKRGAPHDIHEVGKEQIRLFSLSELQKWKKKDNRAAKRRTVRGTKKGIQRKKPRGYLTSEALVKKLGWPKSRARTVRKYASQHNAPHVKVGHNVFFKLSEFQAWFAEFEEKIGSTRAATLESFMKAGPEGVKRKIAKFKAEAGSRNLTRQELSAALGASLGSIDRWITQGVPHDIAASLGGRGAKLRLYNAEEVREWRENMRKESYDARNTGGQATWDSVVAFLGEGHSPAEAAEKFGMSAGGVSNYMRRMGIELATIESESGRDLNRTEIAKLLEVKPGTIHSWTRKGAPFELRKKTAGARPTMFFNLEEMQAWLDARKRRYNPDEPMLPARQPKMDLETLAHEIAAAPPEGSLIPGCPSFAEVPRKEMVPRATFEVMLSGRFPLIRTAEGDLWQVKPYLVKAMSDLMTVEGIKDARAWENLLAACMQSANLYVMDKRGERYKVVSVDIDYGYDEEDEEDDGKTVAIGNLLSEADLASWPEDGKEIRQPRGRAPANPASGELVLQHLGRRSRGGARVRIDIWDAFGKMLPFVTYKARNR